MNLPPNKPKRFLTLFSLLSLLPPAGCMLFADGPAKPAWSYEGWGCAPDRKRAEQGLGPGTDCKVQEVFYYPQTGRASSSARGLARRQAQCREAARLSAFGSDPVRRLYHFLEKKKIVTTDDREYIVTEFSGTIRGAGVYACCPTKSPGGRCQSRSSADPATLWSSCLCLMYFNFPGGQKTVLAKLKSRGEKSN